MAKDEHELVLDIAQNTGKKDNIYLYAYRAPESGRWRFGGGPNQLFIERARTLAVESSIAIDSPRAADPADFWLDRLYRYLCESKSTSLFEQSILDSSEETFPKYGGGIRHICSASATFCSWLERQALEQSADNEPVEEAAIPLTEREGKLWSVIKQGVDGLAYCREVDRTGVRPRKKWLAASCPGTYTGAYLLGLPWQKRIQDEKYRVQKKAELATHSSTSKT
ncbi:MAG TPA: hypothetical protein VFE02_10235 [Candidatus Acidoferrales bacterium]|nr:hypothetical protein [Candidatus Acidoferrales bacterium]